MLSILEPCAFPGAGGAIAEAVCWSRAVPRPGSSSSRCSCPPSLPRPLPCLLIAPCLGSAVRLLGQERCFLLGLCRPGAGRGGRAVSLLGRLRRARWGPCGGRVPLPASPGRGSPGLQGSPRKPPAAGGSQVLAPQGAARCPLVPAGVNAWDLCFGSGSAGAGTPGAPGDRSRCLQGRAPEVCADKDVLIFLTTHLSSREGNLFGN